MQRSLARRPAFIASLSDLPLDFVDEIAESTSPRQDSRSAETLLVLDDSLFPQAERVTINIKIISEKYFMILYVPSGFAVITMHLSYLLFCLNIVSNNWNNFGATNVYSRFAAH